MKKLIALFILSTVFCLGQNIVDDVYHIEEDGRLFTTNIFDDGDKLNLFNWFMDFDSFSSSYFSHITVDDNLNIEFNIQRDFRLDDYAGIIKYNNGFLITDIDINRGEARLVYVEDKNVEVLYDFSDAGKYKHSFFLNDKVFFTNHDMIIRNKDSLRLCFYKANFDGEILDSIIYTDFNPRFGLNFNLLNQKPLKDENGNVYVVGSQATLYFSSNTYILKFNKDEELEFVKLIDRQEDSLLPQPFNIVRYFEDNFLLYGVERDTKKKITYAFIKVYDNEFNELSHHRYEFDKRNQFNSIIVNKDSTLTLYGKNGKDYTGNNFYSSRVVLDKNFEKISYNTFESDTIDHGFHFAVSRENFDIVVGYFRQDLYIAKIEKQNLSVNKNIDTYKAIYNPVSNELIFNEEIPKSVEIIDLIGRNIFLTSEIRAKNVPLPYLPENQALFAKIKFNSIEILQRIK